jgi:hypothetical protein
MEQLKDPRADTADAAAILAAVGSNIVPVAQVIEPSVKLEHVPMTFVVRGDGVDVFDLLADTPPSPQTPRPALVELDIFPLGLEPAVQAGAPEAKAQPLLAVAASAEPTQGDALVHLAGTASPTALAGPQSTQAVPPPAPQAALLAPQAPTKWLQATAHKDTSAFLGEKIDRELLFALGLEVCEYTDPLKPSVFGSSVITFSRSLRVKRGPLVLRFTLGDTLAGENQVVLTASTIVGILSCFSGVAIATLDMSGTFNVRPAVHYIMSSVQSRDMNGQEAFQWAQKVCDHVNLATFRLSVLPQRRGAPLEQSDSADITANRSPSDTKDERSESVKVLKVSMDKLAKEKVAHAETKQKALSAKKAAATVHTKAITKLKSKFEAKEADADKHFNEQLEAEKTKTMTAENHTNTVAKKVAALAGELDEAKKSIAKRDRELTKVKGELEQAKNTKLSSSDELSTSTSSSSSSSSASPPTPKKVKKAKKEKEQIKEAKEPKGKKHKGDKTDKKKKKGQKKNN